MKGNFLLYFNLRDNIGKVLLGNKKDLEDKREVNQKNAEKIVLNLNCKYIEASAKMGEKIKQEMEEIARDTYDKYSKNILKKSKSFNLKKQKKKSFKAKKIITKNCCNDN